MQFVKNVEKRSLHKNSHFLYNQEVKMNGIKMKADFSQTFKDPLCTINA